MKDFQYFMPTKIHWGKETISKNSEVFSMFGQKALIVTGRSSAKLNGSLEDVMSALEKEKVLYCVFDEVEENPSLETLENAGQYGRREKVDFVIGIGGGSPIDTAKAVGVLVQNPKCLVEDLFKQDSLESVPLMVVPTTAGTGTEVTPYAIFTDHEAKTKRNFSQKIFPQVAFLDAKYLVDMPMDVTVNTAVDALSHILEGYLNINANILSDMFAEKGLELFGECMNALYNSTNISYEIREKLLLCSTVAGFVIAQTGTSIPHGMGYALTYYKNVPHGKANGFLLKEYLKICEDSVKINKILKYMNLKSVEDLGVYLRKILGEPPTIGEEEIMDYVESMISNKAKLRNHPQTVTKEDIFLIYKKSME